MRSSVAWPEEFGRATRPVALVGVGLFLLMGIAGVAAPISDVVRGDFDARTPILVLLAPVAFALAALAWSTKVRVRSRRTDRVSLAQVGDPHLGTPVEQGVVIPNQAVLGMIFLVTFGSLVVLCALLALITALVFGGRFSLAPAVVCLVAVVGVLIAARALLDARRRQVVVGQLALAPSGIHYRAPGHDAYVPWSAVQSMWLPGETGEFLIVVRAARTAAAVFRQRRPIYKHAFELQPELAIVGGLLSVDPALAFHAIGYYATHDEARPELAAQAGVERIRAAQFGQPVAG